MKKLLVLLMLLPLCASAQQLWTGVIAPSRAINWSNAGAPNIHETRTQCVTSACNTVSGGTVTAASLSAALASAPAHSYVLIPAGTYTLTAGVTYNSNSYVTLRGAGSNATFLVWSSTSNPGGYCTDGRGRVFSICGASSDNNWVGSPSNSATWSGTNGSSGSYTQGATSILLSSVTNLTVGNPITLDQIDDQSDNSALYVGCELNTDTSTDCYSGTYPNGNERGYNGAITAIRGQQQMVTVTSISGSGPYTVGISPGVYAPNYQTSKSPGAFWATSPIHDDGVENLSINMSALCSSSSCSGVGVGFNNCQGCWVNGVRSVVTSTTDTSWCDACFSISNKGSVRNSYFYGYSGDSYGIGISVASDLLVENNIFHYYVPTGLPNSDCEGCVWGYNFQPGAWSNSATYMGQSFEYHGIDLYILEEGNIGTGINGDSFHGTHDLDTHFRNRWDGRQQVNGANVTTNTVAVRLQPGTRYQNVIGNILGTVGYHTVYKSNLSGSNLSSSVYDCGAYPEGSMSGDALSCPTSLLWGNYDTVTGATRWCGSSSDTGWPTNCGSASEVPIGAAGYPNSVPTVGDTASGMSALPASFYYSSKPSWWPIGKAWPPIGPDVTGGNVGQCAGGTYQGGEVSNAALCTGSTMTPLAMVNSTPAMDCYYNNMGGNPAGTGGPYAFDSNGCYATVAIQLPSGLLPVGVALQ